MIHRNFEAAVLRCARGDGGSRCGGAVVGPLRLAGYGPHYNDHRQTEGIIAVMIAVIRTSVVALSISSSGGICRNILLIFSGERQYLSHR